MVLYRGFLNEKKKLLFTLIELLVTITIIAMLASLLLPALGKEKETARRNLCLSSGRQITCATQIYAMDHNEYLQSYSIVYCPTTSGLWTHAYNRCRLRNPCDIYATAFS